VPVQLPPGVLVYRIDGPFFFGAAEKLESTLERVPLDVRAIVLRLGRVPFMDATGLQTLLEVIERYRRHKVRVLLCGIHPELQGPLRDAGVLDAVEPGDICANLHEVAAKVRTAES
jgi:SulP family sulfate permease